jgi:hypothetical protein
VDHLASFFADVSRASSTYSDTCYLPESSVIIGVITAVIITIGPLQPFYADGISKRINTYQHSESFWKLGQTADFEVEPGGIRQPSESPIAP